MSFNRIKEIIENSFFSNTALAHSTTGDGRLDSAESEAVIISHLIELFSDTDIEVEVAPPRCWYDVAFKVGEDVLYTNIKITSGCQADNVSSKLGLFYTLTGILPTDIKDVRLDRWDSYNKKLLENLNYNCNADYYFVVYFKESESFLITSLKRIQTLVPNGSNLPFQCKWSDNCTFSTRTTEEQSQYLMDVYYNSWLKKIGGFEPLIRWRSKNEFK